MQLRCVRDEGACSPLIQRLIDFIYVLRPTKGGVIMKTQSYKRPHASPLNTESTKFVVGEGSKLGRVWPDTGVRLFNIRGSRMDSNCW